MKQKIKLTALAAFVVAGLAQVQPAAAQDCGTAGTVTVAEMTWLSAATLAHVAQKIMADGYGCDAQLVPGDTVPTATSMLTKSEPMVAPELWISTAQSIWDQMQEKGNVYKAGDIFASGGEEGWWIPSYVAEQNPEIKTIEDLKANWQIFADAENPEKGRLYGCPRLGLRDHLEQPVQGLGSWRNLRDVPHWFGRGAEGNDRPSGNR